MSRRQRSATEQVRRARVAREKALRRRARTRRVATAAAAAVTLTGAGTAGAAVPESAGDPINAGAAQHALAECITPDSDPVDLTDVGGTMFFTADNPVHDFGLWRSDGTGSTTVRLLDFPYNYGSDGRYDDFGYRGLIDVGGTLFFTTKTDIRDGLWRTDGTKEGTVRVRRFEDLDSPGGESGPTNMAAVGDTLFFGASDDLWKSDGTTTGTVLVKELMSTRSGYYYDYGPSDMTPVGDTLFFTADDGSGIKELWKSDGTPGGTVLVKDIYPGNDGYYSEGPNRLTVVGDTLYFTADDGVHGRELWRSDGTAAGTVMVEDIEPGAGSGRPFALTAFAGDLYFSARDDADGSHDLWTSDGTEAGTFIVKDFPPQPVPGLTGPGEIAVVDDAMFFAAVDPTAGVELWKSDGTEAGTVLVEDIRPGVEGSLPRSLTVVGDTLFFAADRGSGRELWTSDGTAAGTVHVADIPATDDYQRLRMTASAGRVYFVADDGVHGEELWTSDGTAEGTYLVRDINRGGGFYVEGRARTNARNTAALVRVSGDIPGRVKVVPVRERGIRRLAEQTGEDTDATLRLELTRAAKRKLRRTGRVEIGARFTFTSCAGAVSRETHSYTVRKR